MELTGDGRSSPSGELNLSRERSNSDPGYRDRIVVMNGGNTVPTRRTPTFSNTSEVASPALGGGANSSTPPPVRRNKLAASIGRLFRPWKWRKRKKSQKFISASENLERQLSVRSKREELVKKGILPVSVKEGTVHESDDDSPEVECNGPSHADNVMNESNKEPLPPLSQPLKPRARIMRPSPVPNRSNLPTENEVKKELQVQQLDRVSMMDQLAQEFARRNIGNSSSNEQTVTRSQNTRHCSTAPEGNKNARFLVVQSVRGGNDHSGKEDSDSEEETRYYSRHDDSCSDSEEEEETRGIITGLASKLKRKDSLALKLKGRPSQSELEARNILPTKTEEEKLERKNEVGTKLIRRLSTRPTAQELIERNILKSSSEEEAKEEKEEKKRVLTRKLSKRPTVQELRAKKILKFNDYVEVCDVHDYDRRADKPWTRLTPEDKAAIRKELNEYKSTEMEVHEESKQYTRFHRP